MSITVRTSIGTPTANSYISVNSADNYFNERYDSQGWLDIGSTGTLSSTDQKGALLIQATREIDRTFRFYGGKENVGTIGASDFQNLSFPRADDTDTNGNSIILEDIQEATCEQALWLLQRADVQVSQDETTVSQPKFSNMAYDLLKKNVKRTVDRVGNYPWQRSQY